MFNTSERKVLNIISQSGRQISIKDITRRFYQGKAPMDSNNYIAQIVRRISKKCKYNKLNWTVDGKGLGRSGRTVWVAKTKKKKKPKYK